MILYITDRYGAVLTEYSHFFDDLHHRELTAGASTYEFSVNKKSEDTSVLKSGNGVILQDDAGRNWFFVILSTESTQYQVKVSTEDASIELLNRMMDELPNTGAHPFSYYVNQIIEKTPWRLNIDQTQGKTRALTYTGQDTGLGRLLSIAKGFDNVELDFRIQMSGLHVVDYYINAVNRLGDNRTNDIQISYQTELNNMTKTESRAKFVTAMRGIGSVIQQEGADQNQPERHFDFTNIEYDDGQFRSPKGDPWIYADKSNRDFNENHGYIEGLYSYDTDSPQELFNRTLAQLKTYSEPSETYEADVKKIDPTLGLGDTVRIIDEEFPRLYLQARVSALDISYTDSSQNTIKFANYEVLTSSLDDRIKFAVSQLPSDARYTWIRYADDDQGKNMSASPAGKSYVAMLANQKGAVMSDDTNAYKGLWVKIVGEKGQPGQPGANTYLHFAWADNSAGTAGFTVNRNSATDRMYMGTYADSDVDQSTNPDKYVWVRVKGEQGDSADVDIPRITVGTNFPTTPAPKTGDLFWQQDSTGHVVGFFEYDSVSSKWNSRSIDQSMLIINELDSVTIKSATINSPEINAPYGFTDSAGIAHEGTLGIKDGRLFVDDYIGKSSGTEKHTRSYLDANGFSSIGSNQESNPGTNVNDSPAYTFSAGAQGMQLVKQPDYDNDPMHRQTVTMNNGSVDVANQWESISFGARDITYRQRAEYGRNTADIDMLGLAQNGHSKSVYHQPENGNWQIVSSPTLATLPSLLDTQHGLAVLFGILNVTGNQGPWNAWQAGWLNGCPTPMGHASGWSYTNEGVIFPCYTTTESDGRLRLHFDTKAQGVSGYRWWQIIYTY